MKALTIAMHAVLATLGLGILLAADGSAQGTGRQPKGSEIPIKAVEKKATRVDQKQEEGPKDIQPSLMAEPFRASAKVASMRIHAEELRKNKQFKDCGNLYAKLASDYKGDPRWAEMLYNAATCFEAARLIGQAIQIHDTLIKIRPNDPLAPKAMHMIGRNYHALSWYSRAAEYYERFAEKFPSEAEAPEALQNAIVFRMGQGDYDKAIEDAHFFTNTFAGRPKLRSRAAAVIFSLASIHEARGNKDALVEHLDSWLKKWGRHGGIDRQILANTKIGMVLWERSCPVMGVNGACIQMKRVRSKRTIRKAKRPRGKRRREALELKTQCGPKTKMKVTVIQRAPAKARKAQAHFKKALALYKKAAGGEAIKGVSQEDREQRASQMAYHAAAARFFRAESDFERFLAVEFPKGLDFREGTSKAQKKKAAESKKKLAQYLKEKGKKLAYPRKIYQDVIMMRQAHWAIAASARIGQLFQNFADALFTAPIHKPPIPQALTGQRDQADFVMAFTDAYCDTLEDKASPIELRAIEGLATCLDKSTDLSWYNEWSKLCERELNQIKPAEYPIAAEIRPNPGYAAFATDRAKAITALK